MAETHAGAAAPGAPPELRHHFVDMRAQREASSLAMWMFLATEVLFFGGMFTAYVVYRSIYRRAFEGASNLLDIRLGAFNTAVLILSSLTMALAVWAASLGKRNWIILFLVATILLGGTFLGVKVVEYAQKFDVNVSAPLGFSNDFAILVRGEDARRLNLKKISDAATYARTWKPGFGQDFMSRADGYPGFVKAYGLQFGEPPREMDPCPYWRRGIGRTVGFRVPPRES